MQFIDARTELLNASSIIDEASLDPYAFQRDAYLQYREAQVNDNTSGTIDYSDTAGTSNDYEQYLEDFNDEFATDDSETQKISKVE